MMDEKTPIAEDETDPADSEGRRGAREAGSRGTRVQTRLPLRARSWVPTARVSSRSPNRASVNYRPLIDEYILASAADHVGSDAPSGQACEARQGFMKNHPPNTAELRSAGRVRHPPLRGWL